MKIKELLEKIDSLKQEGKPSVAHYYCGLLIRKLRATIGDDLLDKIAAAGPGKEPNNEE